MDKNFFDLGKEKVIGWSSEVYKLSEVKIVFSINVRIWFL
jgi:hypothetical protein